MKKLLFLLALVAVFATSKVEAQVQSWPFGVADFKSQTDTAIVVSNRMTFIDMGEIAAAKSLTVTTSKGLAKGALLFVLVKSDGTARAVTFSTGFKANAAMAGVINKTKLATFIYNGTSFYLITTQQVD